MMMADDAPTATRAAAAGRRAREAANTSAMCKRPRSDFVSPKVSQLLGRIPCNSPAGAYTGRDSILHLIQESVTGFGGHPTHARGVD